MDPSLGKKISECLAGDQKNPYASLEEGDSGEFVLMSSILFS